MGKENRVTQHDAHSRNTKMPERICLLGALAGDVIGSVFEFTNQKDTNFPLVQPRQPVDG